MRCKRSEKSSDTLTVHGTGGDIKGGTLIRTELDHRIAMSFLIMGLATRNPITIDNGATIDTSFPDFFEIMKSLGANPSLSDKTKD